MNLKLLKNLNRKSSNFIKIRNDLIEGAIKSNDPIYKLHR